MTDKPEKTRIQINVRLTPAQVAQLVDLTMLYGSQSRAITAAIETHWRDTAEARARFAPSSGDAPGDAPGEED